MARGRSLPNGQQKSLSVRLPSAATAVAKTETGSTALSDMAAQAPVVGQLSALQMKAASSTATKRLARHSAAVQTSSAVAQASFVGGPGGGMTFEHAGGAEIVASSIDPTDFGDQGAPATRVADAPKSAFIWNVPTHGSAEKVAGRYAEPWATPEDAVSRQRLVIGVNTRQSVFETPAAAKARAKDNAKVEAAEGAVGTAVSFVWRPKLKVSSATTDAADYAWPETALEGRSDPEVAKERTEALAKVPYSEIRTTIMAHTSTARYASEFQAADYEPYIHISDPDTPSFQVPRGNAHPDRIDADHPLGGAFAEESDTLLFDRLSELIERRTETREGHPAKPMPAVLAGGYQLRPSSSGEEGAALPLSGIASQIDMQTRRILYAKGRSPVAAYVPEPNLAVRWADLPKSETSPLALDAGRLFGTGTGESPTLIGNIIEKLKADGKGPTELRQAVAFKLSAAIATGATGVGKGGERFRVASEKTPDAEAPVAAPTTVPAAFAEILASGQQHANPNVWFGRALKSVLNETGLTVNDNGRKRLLAHLRFHVHAALVERDMLANLGGFSRTPQKELYAGAVAHEKEAAGRLESIAAETVSMLASYVPAIQRAIAPPPPPPDAP